MPYQWIQPPPAPAEPQRQETPSGGAAPVAELHLWPHRSLPPRGFVWVIGASATGLIIPLLAMLGSVVMWGLLPFALTAIWALWVAIERNARASRATREILRLSRDSLSVLRRDLGREDRFWQANPYWVRLRIRQDGPVAHYLTLTDGQREIEIGRFLSPEEREALALELERALARNR